MMFLKMGLLGLFFVYFQSFKSNSLQFLLQYNVKNVHPVSGPEIWTHNLLNVSLLA